MVSPTPFDLFSFHLVLVGESLTPGERRALFRLAEQGKLIRLRPGVYFPAAAWSDFGAEERFLARISAAVAVEPGPLILSGLSAAAIWRLPFIDSPPLRPEVISGVANGGRSTSSLIRHGLDVPESLIDFGAFAITSLTRTLVDVARIEKITTAVAMTDFSLRPPASGEAGPLAARVTKGALEEELEARAPTTGHTRAQE